MKRETAERERSQWRGESVCLACVLLPGLLLLASCTNPAPASEPTAAQSNSQARRTAFPNPPIASRDRASANTHSFTLLDSRRLRLSDYLGDVVVLDFWATYCPPCREEAPHLAALHRKYSSRGLHIIGLNVGGPDDRPKIPGFIEEFSLPYAMGYPDPEMSDFYLSDNDAIPQLFVFDRSGRLMKRFIGYDKTVADDLERLIKQGIEDTAR